MVTNKILLALFLFPWIINPYSLLPPQQESQDGGVVIFDPLPGSAVQGLHQIIGTIEIEDLDYYSLEFSSQNSQSPTWFLISEQESTVNNNVIGEWDTSILTDGNYNLRLTVYRISNQPITLLVEGVRIRNYTQIETNTPTATSEIIAVTATSEPAVTITPTTTPKPSPTPYPPNPAGIGQNSFSDSILAGGIIGGIFAILISLYVNFRKNR